MEVFSVLRFQSRIKVDTTYFRNHPSWKLAKKKASKADQKITVAELKALLDKTVQEKIENFNA